MAIEGPLKELGLHDVFQLLDLSRKTGVLRVTSPLRRNQGTIYFDRGAVVAAEIRSNPHPLGEILVRSGKVTEADLARAQEVQERGDPRRVGEILVELGCVVGLTLGQQSWLRLLNIDHHEVMAGTDASMAPGFESREALEASKAAPDYWAARTPG